MIKTVEASLGFTSQLHKVARKRETDGDGGGRQLTWG